MEKYREIAGWRGKALLICAGFSLAACGAVPEPSAPSEPTVDLVRKAAVLDQVKSFIAEHLPPGTLDLIAGGKNLVSLYQGANDALKVAEALGRLAGILPVQLTLEDAFNKLQAQLEHMGIALSAQMSESDRDLRVSTEYGAIRGGQQGMLHANDAPDTLSRNAAEWATSSSAFDVFYAESASGPGDSGWKKMIPDRPTDVHNGLIWDWRSGLPHLIQMVGLRLQVIALIDNSFTTDGLYTGELGDYRTALITTINKMEDSIRCSNMNMVPAYLPGDCDTDGACIRQHWAFNLACAEIYSGISMTETVVYAADPYFDNCRRWDVDGRLVDPDQACIASEQQVLDAISQEVAAKRATLRQGVHDSMPFSDAWNTVSVLNETVCPNDCGAGHF
jgi:hypothetical protein